MNERALWLIVVSLTAWMLFPTVQPVRATAPDRGEKAFTVRGRVLAVEKGETLPLQDARVFLTGIANGRDSTDPPVMDQVDETFVPQFLAVRKGTRVVFKNSDTVAHNVRLVRLPEYGRMMNRYVYHGDTLAYRFERTGLVQVECDIHPLMEAHVVVLEDGFRTVRSDGDGRFEFRIPGRDSRTPTVRAWHPSHGLSSARSVDPGGTRPVRILLRP